MKKTLSFILLFLHFLIVEAQSFPVNLTANVLKDYEGFKKGETIKIDSVGHTVVLSEYSPPKDVYYIKANGQGISVNSKIGDRLQFNFNNVSDIWNAEIISSVLTFLNKKGDNFKWRIDAEQDALQFLCNVQSSRLNDPYLENYIYSLISKISPAILVDGRPGNVNIVILESPELNAFTFPNGTIVLYTGLLSALHSEDELVAILSHEIAHFVLDHSYQNYTQEMSRKKRAEFWAAVATGIAAVGDVYLSSKNTYYQPGTITLATAAIASGIAAEVIERLGMKYNHNQEYEADELAIKVLRQTGYSTDALATALARLKESMKTERTNVQYLESYSHPALEARIVKNGQPNLNNRDIKFEQIISFATSTSAILKFSDRRYRQAYNLACQNIENNVGLADDYLIAANCLLYLEDNEISNLNAYNLVQKARLLEPNNINYFKADILTLLRLEKRDEAINKLQEYHVALENMKSTLDVVLNQDLWHQQIQFIDSNQEWARQMTIKLKGMR
ncbi:MAG: M48 family metalloprotease [Bacteroides sp.]|nr:M48 family metalloprotease [Bacteroides sp.]MCM1389477.1 M48 family metalloprotease [Bacteroides sp.]